MRTDEFQPGDLLIVDNLEDVSDTFKNAFLHNPTLLDEFREDKKRITILVLKQVEYVAYNVSIVSKNSLANVAIVNFGAIQKLRKCSLWLEFGVAYWGIPCLARVFRDGKEIHRCLTN